MSTQRIRVHIGKLVVSGRVGFDRAALGAAVQTEMTRLLGQSDAHVVTHSRAHVDAGTIHRPSSEPERLGRQIAHATCCALRSKP